MGVRGQQSDQSATRGRSAAASRRIDPRTGSGEPEARRRTEPAPTPDRAIAALARTRAGVFTRAEALAAGLSPRQIRRRLNSGLWVAEFRGVLRAGTSPDSIDTRERAALAWAGEGAALSHFSAARRWRLGVPPSAQPWLTVPYVRTSRRPPEIRLTRSRCLPASAVRRVDGVPVLEPARTIADLAQYLDERALTAVALEAMQRELCTREQIEQWRSRLAGRAGMALLGSVLLQADPDFESILAAEFGQLMANAGIRLRARFRLRLPPGPDIMCDFADPVARIDFEVDGFAFHSTREQIANDRARDRRLLRAGWITVRYGTDDIRLRPTETVADVLRQIAQRRGSA